jgi:signal transduction histidine kinase
MRAPQGWRAVEHASDVALACMLAILGECELFFRSLNSDFHGPPALNAILVVLFAVPVALRRRLPVAALVAFWGPVQVWLDTLYTAHSNLPLEPFLILLVLVYSAAAYAGRSGQRVVGAVLVALALSEVALLTAGLKGWGNVVPGLVFVSAAYVLGRGVRHRRFQAVSLERRAVELESNRDVLAQLAVTEERDRIARELHDVIAHSVSVMVVQAGAAERLLDRDPERARQALESIRNAGSEALDELRRLLGLLRDNPPSSSCSEPQPGLARLDRLIEDTRDSGIEVSLVTEGTPVPLPPGIELAAYRIIQEALTNVRKHAAPDAKAAIRITFKPRTLEFRVTDDGTTPRSTNGAGTGHGLIGMRERVALYGGTISHGPVPRGGFQVTACIPFENAAR